MSELCWSKSLVFISMMRDWPVNLTRRLEVAAHGTEPSVWRIISGSSENLQDTQFLFGQTVSTFLLRRCQLQFCLQSLCPPPKVFVHPP